MSAASAPLIDFQPETQGSPAKTRPATGVLPAGAKATTIDFQEETARPVQSAPPKEGFLGGAWNELKDQVGGTLKSLIPSKENLYGLSGPGGALSQTMGIVNAAENWERRSQPETTPSGTILPPRSLPYKMLTGATEVLGIPTGAAGQERAAAAGDPGGVLGHAAVPILEAASPLAAEGASKLLPSREAIARAARTPETGRLKPNVANAGRLVGAAGGAAIGTLGHTEYGPFGGALVGGSFGPRLLDFLIPDLSEGDLFAGQVSRGLRNAAIRGVIKDRLTPELGTGATGSAAEPFEPLIYSSPEEAAALDQRLKNLQRQASAAGTFHAAQGAVNKRLNLQQRIGRRLGS